MTSCPLTQDQMLQIEALVADRLKHLKHKTTKVEIVCFMAHDIDHETLRRSQKLLSKFLNTPRTIEGHEDSKLKRESSCLATKFQKQVEVRLLNGQSYFELSSKTPLTINTLISIGIIVPIDIGTGQPILMSGVR